MRDDETEAVNNARNRVLYDGYKNSIIEWTLSNEWYTPHGVPMTGERGAVLKGTDYTFTNECQGEIENNPLLFTP